ncbi:Acid ceramidase [Colletotrichum siamense]|uniref:Acid ceramidase n=1 Tax=Colletotrichum siamense TaxID=690259 RepID=UPI001872987D|nr:Acid ceramidase [Colletotrichum siamense]KAF5494688.1 Acid ceramidase [Colletotrichum siamense]
MSSTDAVPIYRIDLALPPEQRYVQIAKDFAEQLRAIAPLYDLVLAQILVYPPIIRLAKFLVRLCLRRVYDDDENREIRSIAETAGVDLHLVVALNTFLDCLLGCTSGTVPVCDDDAPEDAPSHLMHFRTLDWGMPELADVLVQLDFVDSKSQQPDRVLARSITYAGFVGTLTGVRPLMNTRTKSSIFHQVLVLLGRRPPISSMLRQVLLPPKPVDVKSAKDTDTSSLIAFATDFMKNPSPSCYLIFSTPQEAVVIQKDYIGGNIKHTYDFIAQANHDTNHTLCCGASEFHHKALELEDSSSIPEDSLWLSGSAERQNFIHDNWKTHSKRLEATASTDVDTAEGQSGNGSCIALAKSLQPNSRTRGVTKSVLKRWMMSEPVFNDFTHFATAMDPLSGDVVFLKKGELNIPSL